MRLRIPALLAFTATALLGWSQTVAQTTAGQSIADLLRSSSGADIAWVPAGMLVGESQTDLAARVQYPTDKVAVLKLSGKQVQAALEWGLSYYPTAISAYLFVSGMTYSFKGAQTSGPRLTSVKVGGEAISDTTQYQVAMPRNIAMGGLGFFQVWDRKSVPAESATAPTLESLLKGKKVEETEARGKAS